MAILEVATEGCCKGHPCDNCKICQRGRCCRRDNPAYKLPELGDWNGPIYGKLGVLEDVGDRVECHCCGEWFKSLGPHVFQSHDLTAKEYKAIFGLRLSRGISSSSTTARFQTEERKKHLAGISASGLEFIDAITPEQRSGFQNLRKPIEIYPLFERVCVICGKVEQVLKSELDHRSRICRSGDCRDKFRLQLGANLGAKSREQRPRQYVNIICEICGTEVTVRKRAKKRIICSSRECAAEVARRNQLRLKTSSRPDVRAKMSEISKNQPLRTHCKNGHALTDDNLIIVNNGKCRRCKICRNAYTEVYFREYYSGKRRRANKVA